MQKYILFLISGVLLFTMYSCTETIDIDFNAFEPQIVIEGNVSTTGAPVVRISSTIDFYEPNEFPPVSGAVVTLTDDQGNREVMDEVAEGIYSGPNLVGQIGSTYTLEVEANNESFRSVCQIPDQVKLDSVTVEKTEGLTFFDEDNDSIYEVTVYFQDPADVDNYYRFIEYRNGVQVASYSISDFSSDGLYLNRDLYNYDRELESGDVLTIEMRCIDEDIYTYFSDMQESNPMTATPTNPKSNIENATLGYFSAYTSESVTIEIP